MVRDVLKACVKKVLGQVGVEIRRAPISANAKGPRDSILQILLHSKTVGLSPQTVIDVGAAHGTFTCQCIDVFPNAGYLLVEPLVEYQPILAELGRRHSSIQSVFAAATSHSGEVLLHVHPDLVGSSLYLEVERNTNVNGVLRTVPGVRVDDLIRNARLNGPFLMKADVQGAELEVLQGAEATLQECEYVLLEVSLFKFFQDGPDCCDVVTYMRDQGFVPYDICGLQYRPLDHALAQIDIAFVKEAGLFRRQHFYATPEQREAQTRRLKTHLAGLFQWGQ